MLPGAISPDSFLNNKKIEEFDDMDTLFFNVLARHPEASEEELKAFYQKVPYLNSPLFEPSYIEHLTIFLSNP